MQNYKQLRAWQAASELSQMVLDAFPVRAPRSIPGLRAQILRPAPSVGANIAEGCSRSTRAEFLHFLEIAIGSANELENHLTFATSGTMIAQSTFETLTRRIEVVRRMLIALRAAVQRRMAEDVEAARQRSNAAPAPKRR